MPSTGSREGVGRQSEEMRPRFSNPEQLHVHLFTCKNSVLCKNGNPLLILKKKKTPCELSWLKSGYAGILASPSLPVPSPELHRNELKPTGAGAWCQGGEEWSLILSTPYVTPLPLASWPPSMADVNLNLCQGPKTSWLPSSSTCGY